MDLNWKEARVVAVLVMVGRPLTIREIGARCFPGVRPVMKRDSQVRNSLRKPVRAKRVKQFSAGTYVAARA